MFTMLLHSIKVKYTYKINSLLYSFKRVPLIKEVIRDDIYDTLSSGAFLILALMYSLYRLLIKSVLLKTLFLAFIGIMSYSIALEAEMDETFPLFISFFIICSIILIDIKRVALDLDYDASYMIQMLKVDPKKYILSNYFLKILEIVVVFVPVLLIECLLLDVPIFYSLLLTIFYVGLKLFVFSNDLRFYKSIIIRKIVYYVLFLLGLIPIILLILDTTKNAILISIIFIIFISLLGIYGLIYILKSNKYKQFFNYLFAARREIKSKTKNYNEQSAKKALQYVEIKESNKHGYDLIHDIFVKRHKKVLIEPIIYFSLGTFLLMIVLLYLVIFKDLKLSDFLLHKLSSILLVLYFVNRGNVLTKAMFVNCDHSLLNYRLYRTPKVILEMFKRRLKTLIKLNILPAGILSIGLSICMLCEGGVNKAYILIVALSIICMSIFFSIHNLVLYYLLQPYTENTDVKNKTYTFITGATYVACYMIDMYEPTVYTFGIFAIIFTIIYSIVALILVNKHAPKTFKIHL